MAGLTTATENVMDSCRNKYQRMKYFIEKAFPEKPTVWNEFGYNDYDASRKSQPMMLTFMRDLFATAQRYNTELIAVNFTQAMIDEIETLRAQLNSADTAQESYKDARTIVTQDRVIKMNTVWDTLVNVCRVGKLLYTNNYAKYQRYVLPGEPATPEEAPVEPPPPTP